MIGFAPQAVLPVSFNTAIARRPSSTKLFLEVLIEDEYGYVTILSSWIKVQRAFAGLVQSQIIILLLLLGAK